MDTKCAACQRPVPRSLLVRDHCHECGGDDVRAAPGFSVRGLICTDCNLTLTRHAWRHWERIADYASRHQCAPQLFEISGVLPSDTVKPPSGRLTRRVYFGNGRGDSRYYMGSVNPSVMTVEQIAAMLGTSAGTARDLVCGRKQRIGFMEGGVILCPTRSAVQIAVERGNAAHDQLT